jgi:hypothetical protein
MRLTLHHASSGRLRSERWSATRTFVPEASRVWTDAVKQRYSRFLELADNDKSQQ